MTKIFTSKKNIISIEEFMELYIGCRYDGSLKLTHSVMQDYLFENDYEPVKRVKFNSISKEGILKGEYVIVKDNNNQLLIYLNPKFKSFDTLLSELKASSRRGKLHNIRKTNLYNEGYTIEYGRIERINNDDLELNITEKVNRQKCKCKGKYRFY